MDSDREKKKIVEEFPEDNLIKPTFSISALDETTASSATSESKKDKSPRNSRFVAAIAMAISFGSFGLFQSIWWLLPWPICVVFLHFFREWFRLHGPALTRRKMAFFNWNSVLVKNPNFIPGWEFKWLNRYNPLIVNCCGGEELTADEPESTSPKSATNSVLPSFHK